MIPGEGVLYTHRPCIPRESGDDPYALVEVEDLLQYSPRERG